MVFTVPAHAPIKDYLDIGSRSLVYFEHFEPRYRRAFGDPPADLASYAQLHQRFYEQNGLNEDKLYNASARLQEVLQDAGVQVDSQRVSAQALPSLWQGQAADAAIDMLNLQVGRADADWKTAGTAWRALAGSIAALRSAVKIKADVVAHILEHGEAVKIDGKTPEDVDDIISGTSISFSNITQNSLLSKLWRIFPELAEGNVAQDIVLLIPGTDYRDRIQQRCRDWLDKVFQPDYTAKVRKFSEVCDLTDQGVENVYEPLIGALNQVPDTAYPRPAGMPVPEQPKSEGTPKDTALPTQPGNPTVPTVPAGTPATPVSLAPSAPASPSPSTPSTPASPSVPSTPASPSTPESPSTPASTSNQGTPSTPSVPSTPTVQVPNTSSLEGLPALSQVANQLSPLASGISNLVDAGISSLTGIIKDGVDGAVQLVEDVIDPSQADRDHDGKPDGKPAAEFDVAGKHLKFEMGPDGQLTLMMSEADGKTQEFSLRLDEHGMPVLEMSEPKDGSPAEKPSPTDPAPSAPSAEKPPPADSVPPAGKSPSDSSPSAPPADKSSHADPAPAAPEQKKSVEQPDAEENTGQPGGRPGAPPMRREEDGEHTPKRMPGEQNAEAPFDSGAELAEAGPMGDLAEAGPL
ncbi:hypothetical protein [Nocardia sp. XZ_19_369]|uniref:hypothetical protein n=1 Tax=Nocardia sp. XZ_19_369 TaxID=2769487 RepID=UPI00188F0877|nr:hypothetical protein [Nocardia sp. XZ_19_369]